MSMAHENAVDAMNDLLAELPMEFSTDPEHNLCERSEFRVILSKNVHKVHRALWELQEYLGMTDG